MGGVSYDDSPPLPRQGERGMKGVIMENEVEMLLPWNLDDSSLAEFAENLKKAKAHREATEIWEELYLHPLASKSRGKHNTRIPKDRRDPCPYRTAFQRDSARIIHSVAFRRLMQKTQAFISPEPDYFRTRLTHTLEVFQFSRTIARALRLNEDLTDAIALGHDFGHTPFGHEGERALKEILGNVEPEDPLTGMKAKIAAMAKKANIRFDHHLQSWLIITDEQDIYTTEAFNLTQSAAYGILRHGRDRDPEPGEPDETLEEQVVKWADDIAWINHDINDAMAAGIFSYSELGKECLEQWGGTIWKRHDSMLRDVIDASARRLRDFPEKTVVDGQRMVAGSSDLEKELDRLKDIILQKVWTNIEVERRNRQARMYIHDLFEHFFLHSDELPEKTRRRVKETPGPRDEVLIRVLKDHISGMTDKYALDKYREHLGPATPFRCGEAGILEHKCYWQVAKGSQKPKKVGDLVTLNFGLAQGASAETEQEYDIYFLDEEYRKQNDLDKFDRNVWLARVKIVQVHAHSCEARVTELGKGARVEPGDVLLRHEPE